MLKQQVKRIEKPWGYELVWADTPFYIGKLLFIKAGQKLSLQYHNRKTETIFLQSGQLIFFQDGKGYSVQPGESYHIPAKSVHQMEAFTDCIVFEASLPFPDDVVRLQDQYGREDKNATYPIGIKKGPVDTGSMRPSGDSIQDPRRKGYPDLLSDRLPQESSSGKRV